MTIIERYIDCMKKGDNVELACLFCEDGVIHDSSPLKLNQDILHLEGRMAIEMKFHHAFGVNGGPYPINSVKYHSDTDAWYFITYSDFIIPVMATIEEVTSENKIKRLSIFPL